jgi:hypothetical protein
MTKQPVYMVILTFVVLLLVTAVSRMYGQPQIEGVAAAPETTELSYDAFLEQNQSLNCRYGVTAWNNRDEPWLAQLGTGWVASFNVNFGLRLPDGVEYVPNIRIIQSRDEQGNRLPKYEFRPGTPPLHDGPGGLGPVIAANPGSLWLVGNEVDRAVWQDDMMPAIYATAYHDIYHFIKARDPSAQIAISGLVQVSPGRLQYLDLVWNAYKAQYGTTIPVDVWNMHAYILAERRFGTTQNSYAAIALGTNPAIAIQNNPYLNEPMPKRTSECHRADVYCYYEHDSIDWFAWQIVAMRQWMKEKGQQNKPLIITEYSVLFPYIENDDGSCGLRDEFGECFTPQRVSSFMTKTFNYMETTKNTNLGYPKDDYRLVQQWMWFAFYYDHPQGTANRLAEVGTDSEGNEIITGFSPVGETFKNYVAGQSRAANVFLDTVSFPAMQTGQITDTITATLSASLYNNGNIPNSAPVTVEFFANQALTQPIGTAVLPAGHIAGCARQSQIASVEWANLESGSHPYWVRVGNQVKKGMVYVNADQVFLPITQRN